MPGLGPGILPYGAAQPVADQPGSIDSTLALLESAGYVADRPLATVLFLALKLGRPLFLEGEAGVGKTEIAKVLSSALGRRLIRLQCYEGLDVASAVYEWNYAGQMMAIRLAEAGGAVDRDTLESDLFSERYLVKRPLLQALEPDTAGAPVLLIDELDRTDEAFEAFLLEVLSDFQVTIPELGTVKAEHPPIVIITSNRTREIHDALKRRCLYHWVDYPGRGAGARHPHKPCSAGRRAPVAGDRRLRSGDPEGGSVQGAGRRRNPRLGLGPRGTRCGGARSGAGLGHPRRPAEIPGRHPEDAGQPGQGHARSGSERAEGTRVTDGSARQGEGRLADNIAYFARALRAAGLPVGPGAVLDAIAAVEAARIGTREDFYWTLHAVFVKRHEHSILFDQAFRIFWRRRALIEKLIAQMSPIARRRGQGGEEAAGWRSARSRSPGLAPAGEAGAGREDGILRPPHRLRP